MSEHTFDTFEMKCGQVLRLQPVSGQILQSLTTKMLASMFSDAEKAEQLSALINDSGDIDAEDAVTVFGSDIGMIAETGEKLFVYCAGWGVVDDPPKRLDEELLALLGIGRSDKHRRRAEWVRSLLDDDSEVAAEETKALIAAVQNISIKR